MGAASSAVTYGMTLSSAFLIAGSLITTLICWRAQVSSVICSKLPPSRLSAWAFFANAAFASARDAPKGIPRITQGFLSITLGPAPRSQRHPLLLSVKVPPATGVYVRN